MARFPLVRLHHPHSSCRFESVCRPPFEHGVMWSSSRLRCRTPRPSQSRHEPPPLNRNQRHRERHCVTALVEAVDNMSPRSGVPVIPREDGPSHTARPATHLHPPADAHRPQRASSMRALHFSGLSCRWPAIWPKVAPAFFGATTGLNMASRALIALSYANSPSGETPHAAAHASRRYSAAGSSTAVARSKSSRSAALTRSAKPGRSTSTVHWPNLHFPDTACQGQRANFGHPQRGRERLPILVVCLQCMLARPTSQSCR